MCVHIIILFTKIFIIICLLFWALTFSNVYYLKKKNIKDKKKNYECGFRSVKNIELNLNLNFFFSAMLVILYELELLFLIPLLFNFNNITNQAFSITLLFIFLIAVTLVIDINYKIIKWNF